jgi:hypothetical protein
VTGHRLFLATAALLVVLPWAARADADDGPRGAFRFVWVRGERTETCAGRDAIAQAVTQRLGKNGFSESAPRSIEAVLQHEGDLWEAHIYVRDADGKLNGSRILTSRTATCASIEAAATLAIALVIDPDSAFRPAPPPTSPGSVLPSAAAPVAPPAGVPAPVVVPCPTIEPPPPPSPPPPPPPCPIERPCPPAASFPAAEASPRAATETVSLRAVAAFGLLPALAPGLALSAEIPLLRSFAATTGVLYLPEQRTSNGEFAFGMTAVWLGACARPWETSRTSFSACATAQAGGMHSVVLGLEPAGPGERAWAGASLGAVVRLRILGPLEAEAGVDLVIPFTRYQYLVEQKPQPVFQQGAAAGVGFLGAGLSFR